MESQERRRSGLRKRLPRLPFTRRPKTRQPGAPPGTIRLDPTAATPVLRVIAYGPDAIEEATLEKPDDVLRYLGQWPVTWLNVDGLGDPDIIGAVGRLFDIHRLALEDIVNVHQRPKVEPYGSNLFLVARMPSLDETLETEQLSLILGKGFVVTFQERTGDPLDTIRVRLRQAGGRLRLSGADYLAYAVLDAVIDSYFPVVEGYGERLEAVEDEVVRDPSDDTVRRIYELKWGLLSLRRGIWPQRDALSALTREAHPLIADETRIHLRDCYDHTVQILDLVETCREVAGGLMDVYLSSLSFRMNEVMKVLTVIATVFIPLTFISGVYGMNFDRSSPWNMPELGFRYGYLVVWGLMGLVTLALLIFFWRKGWIGGGKGRPRLEPPRGR